MQIAAFTAKLKRAASGKIGDGKSFAGGRLADAGAAACSVESTLAALEKDEHIDGAVPEGDAAPPKVNVTLGEALFMVKFWALLTACVTFFLYGGQLNLHLPSIFQAEAGKTPVEASSIYSVYNIAAVIGKVLTAFVVTIPACKKVRRSHTGPWTVPARSGGGC